MANTAFASVSRSFELNIGGLKLYPQLWQLGLVLLLLFFLAISMAQFRRHLLTWSFRGAWFGIAIGFVLGIALSSLIFFVLGKMPAPIQSLFSACSPK